MRILMIVPGGVDESGRVRVIPALLALVRRLSENHTLTVAALNQFPPGRSFTLCGAEVVNLGRSVCPVPGARLFFWNRLLKRFIASRKRGFDVVHGLWMGPPSTLALAAGRRFKIPVMTSLMGGEAVRMDDIGYGGSRGWSMRMQLRYALARSHTVTAPTAGAMEPLLPFRSRIRRWTLFPETSLFSQDNALPPPGPPWKLVTISTINAVKDPQIMLQGLRRALDMNPSETIRLHWIGENILGETVHREVRRLKLEAFVVFHGFETYDRLPGLLRDAHGYVQASRFESAGVAVCEAAAAELPVLGTRTGLTAEMPIDEFLTCSPGDPEGLARCIRSLIDNAAIRQNTAAALKKWSLTHTAAHTAGRCEALYREMTADR